MISLILGFKYKIVYLLYFNIKFNIVIFIENNFFGNNNLRLWKNYLKGMGIFISYDLLIGFIEFLIFFDLRYKRLIGSILIGYKLD